MTLSVTSANINSTRHEGAITTMINNKGSLAIRRSAAEQVLEACIGSREYREIVSLDGTIERVVEIPAFRSKTGALLVTDSGKVYRLTKLATRQEIRGVNNTDGYKAVTLRNADTGEKVRVLRSNLVYIAFHRTAPAKGYDIDHINSDRTDDRLCNLRVITHADNIRRGRDKISEVMKGIHEAGFDKGYVVIVHDGKSVSGVHAGKAAELTRLFGVDKRFFGRARKRMVETGNLVLEKKHPNDDSKCVIIPVDHVGSRDIVDELVANTSIYLDKKDRRRNVGAIALYVTAFLA